jgi:hypothetical protein
MRSTRRFIAVAAGLALAAVAAQAAGTAKVSFVQSDMFTDAGNARHDIDANLLALTRHFDTLASRYLSDGQKLAVEVLDIDLAGDVRLSGRWRHDVRIVTGRADFPRIRLRYTLESAGLGTRSSEQHIADMAYLQRVVGRYTNDEPLRYEKRMLDDWFVEQFVAAAAR